MFCCCRLNISPYTRHGSSGSLTLPVNTEVKKALRASALCMSCVSELPTVSLVLPLVATVPVKALLVTFHITHQFQFQVLTFHSCMSGQYFLVMFPPDYTLHMLSFWCIIISFRSVSIAMKLILYLSWCTTPSMSARGGILWRGSYFSGPHCRGLLM